MVGSAEGGSANRPETFSKVGGISVFESGPRQINSKKTIILPIPSR